MTKDHHSLPIILGNTSFPTAMAINDITGPDVILCMPSLGYLVFLQLAMDNLLTRSSTFTAISSSLDFVLCFISLLYVETQEQTVLSFKCFFNLYYMYFWFPFSIANLAIFSYASCTFPFLWWLVFYFLVFLMIESVGSLDNELLGSGNDEVCLFKIVTVLRHQKMI